MLDKPIYAYHQLGEIPLKPFGCPEDSLQSRLTVQAHIEPIFSAFEFLIVFAVRFRCLGSHTSSLLYIQILKYM
jgi:hypothetical protein